MNGDDVAVLDTEVVANDTVEACAAIVKIVIGKDNQDGVLSLLSADENGITTEELELLHGVVGEGDNRVIIVDGVSNPAYVLAQVAVPRIFNVNLHQLVGLLLLLENSSGGIIFLFYRSARAVLEMSLAGKRGWTYGLVLGTRSVPVWLQVSLASFAMRGRDSFESSRDLGRCFTYIKLTFFFCSTWSGLGSGAILTFVLRISRINGVFGYRGW